MAQRDLLLTVNKWQSSDLCAGMINLNVHLNVALNMLG